MKKIIFYSTCIAFAIGATACGGNNSDNSTEYESSDVITVEKVEEKVAVEVKDGHFIDGELAEYVMLVPGEYTLIYDGWKAEAKIKAQVLKQTDKELAGYETTFLFLDENGKELGDGFLGGGWDALNEGLAKGDNSTEYTLTLSYYADDDELPMKDFLAKVKEIRGEKAVEKTQKENDEGSGDDSDEEDSTSSSGVTSVSSSEISKFISDGKSGNIDRMLSAFEWLNKTEAALKPAVRNLNKDAIKAAIALDEANEEIGSEYDAFTLSGALNNMINNMSSSQRDRYNKNVSNTVFYFNASENATEFNDLYRKLRYGW